MAPAGQTCAHIVQPVQVIGSISDLCLPLSFFSGLAAIDGQPTPKHSPHAVHLSSFTVYGASFIFEGKSMHGLFVMTTETSSLSVSEISSVTKRPEKVAGMHFFNPVPVVKLVEGVRGALSSQETVDQVIELAKLMGKTPIVSADSPAFIVNRLLNALACEG